MSKKQWIRNPNELEALKKLLKWSFFWHLLHQDFNYIMKITKTTWFYIIAALVTIYGIVTRQFIFLILSFPLGLYYYTKGNDKKK